MVPEEIYQAEYGCIQEKPFGGRIALEGSNPTSSSIGIGGMSHSDSSDSKEVGHAPGRCPSRGALQPGRGAGLAVIATALAALATHVIQQRDLIA